MYTRVKTAAEIEAMREGGKILATVLQLLKQKAIPGISTKELAYVAAKELERLGGKPAFLGYEGYPDVLCASVNDEVVHGIPSHNMVLKEGDIVGLDFGVLHKNLITDGAVTTIVGKPLSIREKELVEVTERSLLAGIDAVKAGAHIGDIGSAVQAVLDKAGFGIVRDLVGHGVGDDMHEEPNVPNYGHKGKGPVLKSGMTIAIEPMATIGDYHVYIDHDHWTIKTRDGSRSAHFEHTILVTDNGAEILTTM